MIPDYQVTEDRSSRRGFAIHFEDNRYQTIQHFFNKEAVRCAPEVRAAIDSVLSGELEECGFSGNIWGIEIRPDVTRVLNLYAPEEAEDWCDVDTREFSAFFDAWNEKYQRFLQEL